MTTETIQTALKNLIQLASYPYRKPMEVPEIKAAIEALNSSQTPSPDSEVVGGVAQEAQRLCDLLRGICNLNRDVRTSASALQKAIHFEEISSHPRSELVERLRGLAFMTHRERGIDSVDDALRDAADALSTKNSPQDQVMGSEPVAWAYEREAQADIGKHYFWVKEVSIRMPKASEKIRNIQPLYAKDAPNSLSEGIPEDIVKAAHVASSAIGFLDYEERQAVAPHIAKAIATERDGHQEFRLQNDREWRAKLDHVKAENERLRDALKDSPQVQVVGASGLEYPILGPDRHGLYEVVLGNKIVVSASSLEEAQAAITALDRHVLIGLTSIYAEGK